MKKKLLFLFSEHKNAVGGQWVNCMALALLEIIYCREKSAVVEHCVQSMFREDHTTHEYERTTLSDHISLSLPIRRTATTVIVERSNDGHPHSGTARHWEAGKQKLSIVYYFSQKG